jgi:hypothetical protein
MTMRTRRRIAALTVGLSGVLAATLAGPAGAATVLTKPQAKAIVAAGVVKNDDLPKGFFSPPFTAAEPDRADEVEYYTCLGVKRPEFLARNTGTTFLTGKNLGKDDAWTLEVGSSADVVDSLEVAEADQAAQRTAKAVSCYREQLAEDLSRGAELKSVGVELVPATVAGADEAWAYRLTWTVTRDQQEITGNGYLVGSRVGQALLKVLYTGSGKQFTVAEVTGLAAKPLARAKQVTTARWVEKPKG